MSLDPHTVFAFTLVAVLAYVIPGPDWFVVLRQAAAGRRQGLVAAAGVQCGLIVHLTAAAVGVAGLLLASAEAFTVLKLVGAGYLVFLGVRSLLDARRTFRRTEREQANEVGASEGGGRLPAIWAQSFGANVLNPKAALFFVAVLPQFINPTSAVGPQVVLLGALDIGLGVVWWAVFVLAVARFHTFLQRRRGRLIVDTVSGVALTSLGAALALTSRARA